MQGGIEKSQALATLMAKLKLEPHQHLEFKGLKVDPTKTAEELGIKEGSQLEIHPQIEQAVPARPNEPSAAMCSKEPDQRAMPKGPITKSPEWSCFCGIPYKTQEALEAHLAHPANSDRAQHRKRTEEEAAEYDRINAIAEEKILAQQKKDSDALAAGKARETALKAKALARGQPSKEVLSMFERDDVADFGWDGFGAPRVIILVGVQGSGKSFYSDALEERGWFNVNDETAKEAAKLKENRNRRGMAILGTAAAIPCTDEPLRLIAVLHPCRVIRGEAP